MKLRLERIFKGENYTIGRLYIDDIYFCDTLEDTVRSIDETGKVYGKTAIPSGKYNVVMSMSNRFKRVLPLLQTVPHFEGIRIHAGNTHEDTHGCILVGKNTEIGKVTSSRIYETDLIKKMANQKSIQIEIV